MYGILTRDLFLEILISDINLLGLQLPLRLAAIVLRNDSVAFLPLSTKRWGKSHCL